jgi:hypothetical protein
MNVIQHNYPSLIQCLWLFSYWLLLSYFCCYCCYNHYKSAIATVTVTTVTIATLLPLSNYHTTVLLITLLQIFSSPSVVEVTTQLLILANILWLPLCRINKFGLNTLPSKTVAIPYTCGLSMLRDGIPSFVHNSSVCLLGAIFLFIT